MTSRLLIKILLIASAYFIAGKLSFLIAVESEIVTLVIFAAEGIALAGILLFGRKVWPGVFLGQFLISCSVGLDLAPSVLIATINSIEVLLAYFLFGFFRLNKSLSKTRDVTALIVLIFLVLQPISSVFGVAALVFFGVIESSHYLSSVFSWWLGNSMGQLLFTPFLLYFCNRFKETDLIEFMGTAFFSLAFSYLFIIYFDVRYLALLISITMPYVIYLSARKDLQYVTFSVIVIAVVSLYSTHLNVGVFSGNDKIENIISLNFYILSQIMVALFIGVLFAEKRLILDQLNEIALYDYLTGLPNRYLLNERTQQAIAISKRAESNVAVCYIDVDRFKEVNDTLGHDAGDKVLKEITSRIKNNIREVDSLLRIGGDEFVLILTNINHRDYVATLLARIFQTVNKPIAIGANLADVSLSIGVAIYPLHSTSASELLSYADNAMYEAKKAGRNRFVFYSLEMPA